MLPPAVNIVTTDGTAGRFGVTVSAMSSVSADTPKPTLLVCVNETSSSSKPILENGVFCVNVLRDDQASVSDYFAGRFKTADGDKFSCASWTARTPARRAWSIRWSPSTAASSRQYKVGTHHMLFGAVQEVYVHDSGSALIYANRSYGTSLKLPAASAPATGAAETLRLGAYHTFAPYVIPEIMARLLGGNRAIDLRLVEGDQRRIMEGLKAGDIDVALIHDFWQLGSDIVVEQLAPLTPYVLLSDADPLADKPALSLAELAAAPMILLDASPGGEMTLGLFKERGLTPQRALPQLAVRDGARHGRPRPRLFDPGDAAGLQHDLRRAGADDAADHRQDPAAAHGDRLAQGPAADRGRRGLSSRRCGPASEEGDSRYAAPRHSAAGGRLRRARCARGACC